MIKDILVNGKPLNVKFPIKLKDDKRNVVYFENSNGFWFKKEYDQNNNVVYYEDSDASWFKQEYDQNINVVYYKDSNDYWFKKEYDQNNNVVYFEDPRGIIKDNRPKKKELTIEEIEKQLGYSIKIIKG